MRHLKRDVLAAMADGRPRSAGTIAAAADFFPIRAVYRYMRRLEWQGLVIRVDGRRVGWGMTVKGAARLRWFRRHPEYFPRRMGRRTAAR